jgi:trk system potassium uptake protein
VHLQQAGNDVSLVERDPARCAEISEKQDIMVVQGPGSSPRTLEQAGIAEAEMVLAVTSIDEVNILVCGMAKQYGVKSRVARIRSGEFIHHETQISLDDLGVTQIIDPERIMVRVINQIAQIPDAIEVFSYHSGQILIARQIIRQDMPILGKSLVEILKLAGEHQLLAVALKRRDSEKVWIPTGDDLMLEGDDITSIFPRESLGKYQEMLALTDKRVRKAVVAGDGLTAIQLCEQLETWVEKVVLIDSDPDHAEIAAAHLDKTEVLHGWATERDMLHEVNVDGADLFVGAGRETSPNVMSCLLARSEGARRVIAVSYEPKSNRLFREIGIHHVLSPRRALAQEILDFIHGGSRAVELQMRDLDLESVQLVVGKNAKITKGPLSKVWTPYKRQAIVGALFRGNKVLIPRGDTVLEPNDEVVVIVKPKHINRIHGLFKNR